ncbi:MAG: flavin reductase [Clostridia bacterium]|nr:flavin reductase [Clostridia bacterium]
MDKTVLHDVSYGLYIVSTNLSGKNVGCVANSFCQITSSDLTVALSLNKNNFTNIAIKKSKKFALSIISEETNPELIKTFGFQSSRDVDKFQNFEFDTIEDLPVVKENTTGCMICEVFNIVDTGTHDIFLAHVTDAERFNSITPMTYSYYHKVVKGKTSKNAPTYVEEEVSATDSKKYRCLLCGYIYDDAKESIPFAELPDDWQCPICGATKSFFKEI